LKGKSLRTIYYKIDETRSQIGTWNSRRTAAAYYASAVLGIDVYRILKDYPDQLEELAKVGGAQQLAPPAPVKVITKFKTKPQITVDETTIQTFLLPNNLATQADKMAKVYPFFYVFENLLRYVIKSTLEKKFGKNWWNLANISRDIRNEVKRRKKSEGKNRWVGKRGIHNIFYTNLGDLVSIISNNYADFKDLFPSLTWIKSRVDDLEQSRNILAHNNVLPEPEIKRIELYLEDLQKQLSGKIK
jgi:hypothetical protein